jgi:acetyl-CoA synthetase
MAGYYFTGDGARRDADGYYWVTGRMDDVLNVSGHRLGTAEIESAINSHPSVAESAVVGIPHKTKGEGIYAFVTLKDNLEQEVSQSQGHEYSVGDDTEIYKQVRQIVRAKIGPLASPETIQIAEGLPKTRSGKIMRRVLKKVALGDTTQLGDTSALVDPSVVDTLISGHSKLTDAHAR